MNITEKSFARYSQNSSLRMPPDMLKTSQILAGGRWLGGVQSVVGMEYQESLKPDGF